MPAVFPMPAVLAMVTVLVFPMLPMLVIPSVLAKVLDVIKGRLLNAAPGIDKHRGFGECCRRN